MVAKLAINTLELQYYSNNYNTTLVITILL